MALVTAVAGGRAPGLHAVTRTVSARVVVADTVPVARVIRDDGALAYAVRAPETRRATAQAEAGVARAAGAVFVVDASLAFAKEPERLIDPTVAVVIDAVRDLEHRRHKPSSEAEGSATVLQHPHHRVLVTARGIAEAHMPPLLSTGC